MVKKKKKNNCPLFWISVSFPFFFWFLLSRLFLLELFWLLFVCVCCCCPRGGERVTHVAGVFEIFPSTTQRKKKKSWVACVWRVCVCGRGWGEEPSLESGPLYCFRLFFEKRKSPEFPLPHVLVFCFVFFLFLFMKKVGRNDRWRNWLN